MKTTHLNYSYFLEDDNSITIPMVSSLGSFYLVPVDFVVEALMKGFSFEILHIKGLLN